MRTIAQKQTGIKLVIIIQTKDQKADEPKKYGAARLNPWEAVVQFHSKLEEYEEQFKHPKICKRKPFHLTFYYFLTNSNTLKFIPIEKSNLQIAPQ